MSVPGRAPSLVARPNPATVGRDMTLCPSCLGSKKLDVLVLGGIRRIDCNTCKGIGAITPEHAWRVARGGEIRDWRERHCTGLREAATFLGIQARTLSAIERGDAPRIVYVSMMKRLGIGEKV